VTRKTYMAGLLVAAVSLNAILLTTRWNTLRVTSRCVSSGHLLKCLNKEPFDFETELFGCGPDCWTHAAFSKAGANVS
jgi:hypothetical protein